MPNQIHASTSKVQPPVCPGISSDLVQKNAEEGLSVLDRFQKALAKKNKVSVTVRYDADVLEWFQSMGKGYQTMMNAALRAFMEEAKAKSRHVQE